MTAIQKKFNIIIVVLLILFHLFNNIYFLYSDETTLVWDTNFLHQMSVKNFREFKDGHFFSIIKQYVLFDSPPLSAYPSFILYPFFGISEDVASFQGTVFLIILIIATYLLGKELFNKKVGLIASILVSFSPFILAISKISYEDITFTTMFTLTLYFFLRSKKFSDIKYTWFFNISLGLTLLSKVTSLFILFPISLSYILLNVLFNKKDFKNYFSKWKKRNVVHFLISFSSSLIFISLYMYNILYKRINDIYLNYDVGKIEFFNCKSVIFSYFRTFGQNFEYNAFFIISLLSFFLFLIFFRKNKLLISSLIVGSNLFHLFFLFVLPIYEIHVARYLIFINIVYIVLISFFILRIFYLPANLFKFKIKRINIEKYFYYFIFTSFVFLIFFTLIFNYTSLIPDFTGNYPHGRYHPTSPIYKIEDISNTMNLGKFNQTIFIFFPMNNFVLSLNSFVFHNYNNTIIVNPFFNEYNEYNFKFREGLFTPLPKYDNFIRKDSFEFNHLYEFDYVILRENRIWNEPKPESTELEYNEFYKYHGILYDYLDKNNNFKLIDKIKIDKFNTTIVIFEQILNKNE
jgi:4-amino-4-deoxy-L-arabinose transferase-like glycosyltransferase